MDAMTKLGVTSLADLVLEQLRTEVGNQPEFEKYSDDNEEESVPQHGDAKISALHYPTDQREREKQQDLLNKAKGIEKVVQKKKQIVEQHWDDCGSDLSAIGCPDNDDDEEVSEEEDNNAYTAAVDYEWELVVDQVYLSNLIASSSTAPPPDRRSHGSRYYYRTLREFLASHHLHQRKPVEGIAKTVVSMTGQQPEEMHNSPSAGVLQMCCRLAVDNEHPGASLFIDGATNGVIFIFSWISTRTTMRRFQPLDTTSHVILRNL